MHNPHDSHLFAFFYGALFNLFASVTAREISEYALKAAIGGCIWLVFKITADLIQNRIQQKNRNRYDKY